MKPDSTTPIVLDAKALTRVYEISNSIFSKPQPLRAVNGVSFTLEAGRTLAVVGESGCGKSTLARLITMIERPSSGSLSIAGVETTTASPEALKALRSTVQLVFQDPFGSLNPRKRVYDILEEPLLINTSLDAPARQAAIQDMLRRVGLRPEFDARYPHMFSGGQRQRIAIARALMLRPRIIVADEPVSALDISVRAQILNLLMDIQEEFQPAYLFISHDLAVVERIAHRVIVMYLGTVVEAGETAEIFSRPLHPYTQALIAAAPTTEKFAARVAGAALSGELPSPLEQIEGCALARRCPLATARCRSEKPELGRVEDHFVACHFPGTRAG